MPSKDERPRPDQNRGAADSAAVPHTGLDSNLGSSDYDSEARNGSGREIRERNMMQRIWEQYPGYIVGLTAVIAGLATALFI